MTRILTVAAIVAAAWAVATAATYAAFIHYANQLDEHIDNVTEIR